MLVSRIVRNHIFRMPKCVKFAHTMLGSLNRGFHDSAKNEFSSLQNGKNELKNARCPRNRGFRNSAKIAFSGPQNEEYPLDCFHQLTSLFPSIDRQVSEIDYPVSVNRPPSFRIQTIQFPSIDRHVSFKRTSSLRQ